MIVELKIPQNRWKLEPRESSEHISKKWRNGEIREERGEA